MTRTQNPLHTLGRLRPTDIDETLRPGEDTQTDEILHRVLDATTQRETIAPGRRTWPGAWRRRNRQRRSPRFRRNRGFIAAGVITAVAGAGGSLTWAFTRDDQPRHPLMISCYSAADLHSNQLVVARTLDDPVETCRAALEKSDPSQDPAPSVACLTRTGTAAVFPGDESTCENLGLADLDITLSDDEAHAIAFTESVTNELSTRGCQPPDVVGRLVEEQFSTFELDEWRVTYEHEATADEPCGSIAIDVPTRTVTVIPIPDLWNDQNDPTTVPPTSSPDSAASGSAVTADLEDSLYLIDAPGWTISSIATAGPTEGEVTFDRGNEQVLFSWFSSELYEGAVSGLADVYEASTIELLGGSGTMYIDPERATFRAITVPISTVVYDIRSDVTSQAAFEAVLDALTNVTTEAWTAALPSGVIPPSGRQRAVDEILADIDTPNGFVTDAAERDEFTTRYHLGAEIVGSVVCAWFDQYFSATERSDQKALDDATAALQSSHDWPILTEMAATGDFPESVWEFADAAAAAGPGTPLTLTQEGVHMSLGCQP